MTPEGRVKKKLKAQLEPYKPTLYAHWPVLTGMGKPELDCNIIYTGIAISIECKAPLENFTKRQIITARSKMAAGAIVLGYRGDTEDVLAVDYILTLLGSGKPGGYLEAFKHAVSHTVGRGYYG